MKHPDSLINYTSAYYKESHSIELFSGNRTKNIVGVDTDRHNYFLMLCLALAFVLQVLDPTLPIYVYLCVFVCVRSFLALCK